MENQFEGQNMLGIFLDSETNGLDPNYHRIIEIAFKIIDLYTGDIKEIYQTIVKQSDEIFEKSDLESLKINQITLNEIKNGKEEKQVAEEIINCFEQNKINNSNSVFICQNPSFDRMFLSQIIPAQKQNYLNWPYHWLDLASMYWSISIKKGKEQHNFFPWETGFTKDLIASFYNIPSEKKPHRAMNGVNHLIACYTAVVGFPYSEKK